MGYRLISKHFPLLVSETEGQPTAEESEAFREAMEPFVNGNRRFGQIVDLRDSTPEDHEQRKLHAVWMRKHHDALKSLSVGVVLVSPSVAMRMSLNFVFFFAPLPMPNKVVGTIPEAKAWIEARFADAGLEFPEGADAYLEELEKRC